MRRFYRTFEEEPSVNLTPLIDVVFIVLIMFILIAPFLEIDHIHLASKPKEKEWSESVEKNNLSIVVKEDNTIWFASQCVSKERLLSLLKEAHQTRGDLVPQLFHDKKAQFGTYQSVKNCIEMAGFSEMDVVLQSGDE